jgi:hypothetical protein
MEDAICTAIVPAMSTGGGVALGVHPATNTKARAKSPITSEYKNPDFIFFSDLTKVWNFTPLFTWHRLLT